MEISSCSADSAHRADDGQRVQDDGRHSEVMIMIAMITMIDLEDFFVQGWQVQAAQGLARD